MLADRYRLDGDDMGRDTVLDRPVALRRVGPGREGASEVRLGAIVHHPNVVAVYDLVDDGDDQWLVMEHVVGPTLADVIAAGDRVDERTRTTIVAQISDALATAHARGIVHGDVSPSAIHLRPDGTAKLSPFGVGGDPAATPADDLRGLDEIARSLPTAPVTTPASSPAHAAEKPASRTAWIAAGALAAVVAAVLLATLGDDSPDDVPVAAATTAAAAPADDTEDPTDGASTGGVTAGALEGFAADYLATASNDPAAGFAMLTPAFQRESDGIEGYTGFWSKVSDLDLQRVDADPAALTVSYTYSYDYDGDRRSDAVTLRLEETADGLRIAGEV